MATPNLGLLELSNNQLNPENTINSFLSTLDAVVQLSILDTTLTAPPGTPFNGDRYIPAATATGAWAGQENNIAYYYNGWSFITPKVGWEIYDFTDSLYKNWDGYSWVPVSYYDHYTNEKANNYQVVATDIGSVIVCNHSSPITITLDEDITDIGVKIDIINRGTATVTIAVEGSDTLQSVGSNTNWVQYAMCTARRIASGVWYLTGDLS